MTDDLNSPSLKTGNVLALLNTLYASGFAMASSSTPLLKGKTLHTLYALSFVVYVTNSICSWLHITFVVKGFVTSFPLNDWIIYTFVVIAVCGTMFTWLLFVLCIENAFAHRLNITPYRSGCALVFEAFIEWTQAFNNFRISFLIMALHDAPITILNFFFVTACRCPNPKILTWPLVLSAVSSTVSLAWRLTVLYFSYKRMICGRSASQQSSSGVSGHITFKTHFENAIYTGFESNGGRIQEYDETWPFRWSRLVTLGPHPENILETPGDVQIHRLWVPNISDSNKNHENFIERFNKFVLKFQCCNFFLKISGYSLWFFLTVLVYIGFLITCCTPCFYHYTCRKNSFYHRHKLCRNFIKYFSLFFHYTIFYSSLFLSLILVVLNLILLSSVHGVGSNNIPPEIDQICVTVSPMSHVAYVTILPNSAFQGISSLQSKLNKKYAPSDKNSITECKPFWEDGGLGIGLARQEAGTWEIRISIEGAMLAVATHVTFNNTILFSPKLRLEYTHSLFVRHSNNSNDFFECSRKSGWQIVPSVEQLSWPYFSACEQNWDFEEISSLIQCNTIKKRKYHRLRHNSNIFQIMEKMDPNIF